ncbi:MAG: dTDP-glucose 4,6-dehydratase [Planctomycetaceae bacterium]|nr:dTDP-glucose 4,6-dehydratase [Planctomycetaceae bacterium]
MRTIRRILVTGGAGFIGANFVHHLLASAKDCHVFNLDLLTYAGSRNNLRDVIDSPRHTFIQGDVADQDLVSRLLRDNEINAIAHFAAESHVDRSIAGPEAFIQTNIVGTFRLLEAARLAWQGKFGENVFLHVSTDEVYGTLAPDDEAFTETNAYAPNSPYAASKAASDHLVRAYFHTYGLRTVTTNCSNNYGPYQYPEKLIPLMIINALTGKPLPVYGDGLQVRDWLYVTDHCRAIETVLKRGRLGDTYNIGGLCERANIEIVQMVCGLLDELRPRSEGGSYYEQIVHVEDRPGHDRRYAIDPAKIGTELGWRPFETLQSGLRKTVLWYLDNQDWVNAVMGEKYREWIALNYAARTGGELE